MVNYGYEVQGLQKTKEDLLDVFRRNCLWTVLSTYLADPISDSKLYKKSFNPAFLVCNERKVEMAGTHSRDEE